MEVILKLDNLEENVKQVLESDLEETIKVAVSSIVCGEVDKVVKKTIETEVNNNIVEYIQEYLTTTTIKIGGGYFDEKKEETLTVEQFIKRNISEYIETGKLKLKHKDRYGDWKTRELSFEEFIEEKFDAGELVEEKLTKFMSQVRNDVNKKIEQQFNEITKQSLSDTMLNLLSKNDTFVKIQDNIKSIASRTDE